MVNGNLKAGSVQPSKNLKAEVGHSPGVTGVTLRARLSIACSKRCNGFDIDEAFAFQHGKQPRERGPVRTSSLTQLVPVKSQRGPRLKSRITFNGCQAQHECEVRPLNGCKGIDHLLLMVERGVFSGKQTGSQSSP
jgi:hypothetical protein